MVIERVFVKEGIKQLQIEEFLAKRFERAGYSHTEIQRTPFGTRIIVYAHKPGLVIGRSGRTIKDLTDEIKRKFNFENPMIDVKEIDQPFLDARIVAKRIAKALEKGVNYKKVTHYYLEKVMEAGATGILINISGKLGGEKARKLKAKQGYVKQSGEYSSSMVDKGQAQAMLRMGIVGVKVDIMKGMTKEFIFKKETEKKEEEVEEEKQRME